MASPFDKIDQITTELDTPGVLKPGKKRVRPPAPRRKPPVPDFDVFEPYIPASPEARPRKRRRKQAPEPEENDEDIWLKQKK